MKIVFSGIIIFSTFFACAQKDEKSAKAPGESVIIKMSKFPIADFPKKSIHVSDIQVIQVVRDSVKLGYAMKGMDGYIVNLNPAKPLTEFLQEHIIKMYKDEYRKDGVKILWVIKELRLGEKSGFMEYAYTRFNADTYISKEGNLFKKICSIDTVFVKESGVDVTKWHGDDIEYAFKLLLKRTLLIEKDMTQQSAGDMTIAQIIDISKPQLNLPILSDLSYSEGAYANYDEFLQNKPSIINYEAVVVDKQKVRFINNGENKDTLEIWGLCKSGEIYKYYEETLIPIERQGTRFIISNYIEKANRHNRNLLFFGFVGGVAGGIVGGTAASLIANAAKNKLLLVKSIPYITSPGKQPLASGIDMRTGEFTF